jgi:chorismate mutase
VPAGVGRTIGQRASAAGTGTLDTCPKISIPPHSCSVFVHLLAERFKFTQQVGRLKAASGLPPADPAREQEQITKLKALASESHLDPAFGEKFLNFIIAEVIHQHEQIASTGSITTQS